MVSGRQQLLTNTTGVSVKTGIQEATVGKVTRFSSKSITG